MSEALLSPVKVHEQTEIAVQTLANWRSQGTGPKFIKIGRLVRYYQSAIDEWLIAQSASN